MAGLLLFRVRASHGRVTDGATSVMILDNSVKWFVEESLTFCRHAH